jgi:glycosyltransferase involved in cell wall biosynthesis
VDKLIALRFPAYYVRHLDKVIWLLHQHRAVYDLYDEATADESLKALREQIHRFDTEMIGSCPHVYANSENVARRLKRYNRVDAAPLYHPPFDSDRFYCGEQYPYIFYPSRQEHLKRQHLLIEAMRHVRSDIKLILSGVGGMAQEYRGLVERYSLHDRVAMLGHIPDAEKFAWYANALAVAYPPSDEDYGYVTLEAMLSSKPVLTCTDSGGPLEFVVDGQTGFVVPPEPQALAEKIDWLCEHRSQAARMGQNGRVHYAGKQISWDHVVQTLLYGG